MTVGIIGAMDEEINVLREHIVDKQEITVANIKFIIGKLANKHIVLLKSGIGKVNASMATTIMHERFSPTHVINTGSAGGYAEKLQVGDVVISSEVIHHDVDVTAFEYQFGQVPGLPTTFQANEALVFKAEQAVRKTNIAYEIGLIGSGDVFVGNEVQSKPILKRFPQLIAVEMEAAAIGQVCYQYNVPFVIIRALSDIAGKQSSISFDKFLEKASKNAASIIINMLNEI